jgi:hypothetical protein
MRQTSASRARRRLADGAVGSTPILATNSAGLRHLHRSSGAFDKPRMVAGNDTRDHVHHVIVFENDDVAVRKRHLVETVRHPFRVRRTPVVGEDDALCRFGRNVAGEDVKRLDGKSRAIHGRHIAATVSEDG